MVRESEFGRGYATSLLMFVNHETRLLDERSMKHEIEIWKEIGKDEVDAESHFVEMWANGSADHLYEFVTGGRISKSDRAAAKSMVNSALMCGHGFAFKSRWTIDQAKEWIAEARRLLRNVGDPQTIDEAMQIDRNLGLRPEKGSWSCPTPIPAWSSSEVEQK